VDFLKSNLPIFSDFTFNTKREFDDVLNKSIAEHFQNICDADEVKQNLLIFNNISYKYFWKDQASKKSFENIKSTNYKSIFWGVVKKHNIVLCYAPNKMYLVYLRMYIKKCILISILVQVDSVFNGLPKYIRDSNISVLSKHLDEEMKSLSNINLFRSLRVENGNIDIELLIETGKLKSKYLKFEDAASILFWDYGISPDKLINASVEVLYKSVQFFLSSQKSIISQTRKEERKEKDKERKRQGYNRRLPSRQDQIDFINECMQKYGEVDAEFVADKLNLSIRTVLTRMKEMDL
jgi:hypothetical protein